MDRKPIQIINYSEDEEPDENGNVSCYRCSGIGYTHVDIYMATLFHEKTYRCQICLGTGRIRWVDSLFKNRE